MEFKKCQIVRGKPELGHVWHPCENGQTLIAYPSIYDSNNRGIFQIGPYGTQFKTLQEAKTRVRSGGH